MKSFLRGLLPDILVILGFVVLSMIYFSPVLNGKQLPQHDITQAMGASHELNQYYEKTGEDAMWTNSMFGGMPAYQIRGGAIYSVFHTLSLYIRLGLPYNTAGIVFIYLLGFYILLRTLKFNYLLAAVGAVAFGFTSYNIIIIAAGHITKGYAIGYMAPVLAGVILTLRKRYIAGGMLTLFFFGMQVAANHYQITYYLILMIGLLYLAYLVDAIRKKELKPWILSALITLFVSALAIVPSTTILWTTYEYTKYSTRGPSELSVNAEDKSAGLDRSYILNDYSYGVGESLSLMIPDIKGGASASPLSNESNVAGLLRQNNYPESEIRKFLQRMPTYWGEQLQTSGPVYLGAIACFLFLLGLFLVTGPMRWWLIASSVIAIFFSWGKHFPALSNLLIDYLPLFNKFRTVSMILVIASVIFPLTALLGFKQIMEGNVKKEKALRYLKIAYFITAGIALFLAVFGKGLFSFTSSGDANMQPALLQALQADRASLLRADAFRSFIFITLAAGLVWLTLIKKLMEYQLIGILALLFIIDLWPVDKRYLNNDNFVTRRAAKEDLSPSPADIEILKDTTNYRVANFTAPYGIFNDGTTSYFHHSVGGYHGAKLRRFQEVVEHQISKNNMHVFDMLNTKYFIVPGQDNRGQVVQENPNALGNAWLVDSVIWAPDANAEMEYLSTVNPASAAIINKKFSALVPSAMISQPADSADFVRLNSYAPGKLSYLAKVANPRIAVFSEIYYPLGWKVWLDGKPTDYFCTDYILRGMEIPAGQHEIRFSFEPRSYYLGRKISFASSFVIVLLLLGGSFWEIRKKLKQEQAS